VQVIKFKTNQREEFVEVTSQLRDAVRDLRIQDGAALVYVPHTTAGLLINENADPTVGKDIVNFLQATVPRSSSYLHGEGNSDAHIKAALLGSSEVLPIVDGEVKLGTWQGLFFAEFDGPRERKIWVCKC